MLNQPWHMLHPCCTADLMTALLGLQQQQGLYSLQEHALQQHLSHAEQLLLPSEQHLKANTTSCVHEEQCREAVYQDTATCGMITSPLQGQAGAAPIHSLLEDEDLPDIDDLITAEQQLGFHDALICADTQLPAIGQEQQAPAAMPTTSQHFACDIKLPEDAGDQVLLLYMKAWWGLVGRVLV